MAIKKVLLQKQVEGTLYQIYPKSDATIIDYSKTVNSETVNTTVAAELAALATAIANNNTSVNQAIATLRNDVFGILGDGESISATFDTIKEIATFLDAHDESIGALADLIADVGTASQPESAAGAGDAVVATGLHADVETLRSDVNALQQANGTNVSKNKAGASPAGNGELYLDGVLTTVYSDADIQAKLGASTDTAAAAGTTAWSRILDNQDRLDDLEDGLGTSGDTASASGTTAWAHIKALEAVGATKVEAATSNGYIKVNGTDNAVKVYDDTDVWAALGHSTDTASAAGTTAWARLLQAEGDIDTLESNVGASTDSPSANGTTLWSRVKAIEAWEDQVQLVAAMPQTPSNDVLYMVEIQ